MGIRVSKVLALAFALVMSACARNEDFLFFTPHPKPILPQFEPACKCPEGYVSSPDGAQCTKETIVDPIRAGNPTPILLGDVDSSYASWASHLVDVSGRSATWPFEAHTRMAALSDARSTPIPSTSFMNPFLRERVVGGNRISVKGLDSHVEYTKTFCVDVPRPRDYVIHIGADNIWKVKVNGKQMASCNQGGQDCFANDLYMKQDFAAGKSIVELKYTNTGGPGAVWFEMFENTLDEIRASSTEAELKTLYSSRALMGDVWDYSGEVCPTGYVYDLCSADRKCKKIDTFACPAGPAPQPSPSPSPSPGVCACAPGFVATPDGSQCTREIAVDPIRTSDPQPILLGDVDSSYHSWGAHMADVSSNRNWPFSAFQDVHNSGMPALADASRSTVQTQMFTPADSGAFWRDRVVGGNRVTVRGPNANVEYTKTFCVDIQSPKDYVIHIGADNTWRMKMNGVPYADCHSDHCFVYGLFMNQSFPAGKTRVELKYTNHGGPGSVWFEVFDNTLDQIRTVQSASSLRTVYSTSRLVGDVWDYTGEICPNGYVYDVCSSDRRCRKIETQACSR